MCQHRTLNGMKRHFSAECGGHRERLDAGNESPAGVGSVGGGYCSVAHPRVGLPGDRVVPALPANSPPAAVFAT
jgi:hypothetical protein